MGSISPSIRVRRRTTWPGWRVAGPALAGPGGPPAPARCRLGGMAHEHYHRGCGSQGAARAVGPAAAALSGYGAADVVPGDHDRGHDHAVLRAVHPGRGGAEDHRAVSLQLHRVRRDRRDRRHVRGVRVAGRGAGGPVGPGEPGGRRAAADRLAGHLRDAERVGQGGVRRVLRAGEHRGGGLPGGHAGLDPRLLPAGGAGGGDGVLDDGAGAGQPGGDRGLQPHPAQPPGLAVPVPAVRRGGAGGVGDRADRAAGAVAAAARSADGEPARPGAGRGPRRRDRPGRPP